MKLYHHISRHGGGLTADRATAVPSIMLMKPRARCLAVTEFKEMAGCPATIF